MLFSQIKFRKPNQEQKMFQALMKNHREFPKIITRRLSERGETVSGKLRTNKAKVQGNIAYATRTMLYKREKEQPIDRVTLKDTGAFHKSFRSQLKKTELKISANFQKDGEHISENFFDNFFPDEFEIAVTSLTDNEIEKLKNEQHKSISETLYPTGQPTT